jgi:hypothetical protein
MRVQQAGIDLGLLTATLCAAELLEEPDEVWDFDRILQEASQAATAEQEKRDLDDIGAGLAPVPTLQKQPSASTLSAVSQLVTTKTAAGRTTSFR